MNRTLRPEHNPARVKRGTTRSCVKNKGLERRPGSIRAIGALGAAALACLSLASAVQARELGTAPELRVLGFSADGRYFGIEQEGGDGISEKGAFAVDVADRDTGRSAAGFPRGATQFTFDSARDDARRAGIRGFRFTEDDADSASTAAIRRWVRQVSRQPLAALALRDPGRRLGGRAITDLSEGQGPVRVVERPDIVGAHPGTSLKFTVTADMPGPDDPDLACRDRETAATYPLTVKLTPEVPDYDREVATRYPELFRERSITVNYVLPPKTCFVRARVTDIYRNDSGTSFAVVLAMVVDAGFTDSAEYRAFVFPRLLSR